MSLLDRNSGKAAVDNNLPSGQRILISVLRSHLKDMWDSSVNRSSDAPNFGLKPFSQDATYQAGDTMVKDGKIYQADEVITPGPFSADQWTRLAPDADPVKVGEVDYTDFNAAGLSRSFFILFEDAKVAGKYAKQIFIVIEEEFQVSKEHYYGYENQNKLSFVSAAVKKDTEIPAGAFILEASNTFSTQTNKQEDIELRVSLKNNNEQDWVKGKMSVYVVFAEFSTLLNDLI